jgi:hypothetical protein
MFQGGNRIRSNKFYVDDAHVTLKPYNSKLNEWTQGVCSQIGLHGANDVCLFESRLAADCVIRGRTRKFGDIEDNVGQCAHHVASFKRNVGLEVGVFPKFESIIDEQINQL